MPNQLARETSPYLLQHQHNPVDWRPWGEAAFAAARAENKPVFLSIGYSACHWCHVMAHESFEDEGIAALLNRDFISVKVDREERPDVDQIYMSALHVYFQMTGSPQGGGWPLNVFLTPQGKPFLGGTYWPPRGGYGRPGFADVLEQVARYWREEREKIEQQAQRLTDYLQDSDAPPTAVASPAVEQLSDAALSLQRGFDQQHGGFGRAPKFPHPLDVRLLLQVWRRGGREHYREMATRTLEKMAGGGIYDQLGGGFARYSVDERWLVPHFEKMLYDNAMLARCYVEAHQATGEPDFARVARETLDYVLREMTHERGGFFSAQDADSEGEEGKFYVWTPGEVQNVLGREAAATFCRTYDVSDEGNFEGRNILNLPKTLPQCAALLGRDLEGLKSELAASRAALLAARNRRVPPGRDDKVLAGWNALTIDALSLAAAALDEPRYLQAARRAADFVLGDVRRGDGRLLHSWKDGQARFDGYLDDYACLANALVTLYEACFEERYVDEAVRLAETMLARFADPAGGFFYVADDHEALIARRKDFQDSPLPSGNGMAATALLRLGRLTGRGEFLQAAAGVLEFYSGAMRHYPTATAQLLLALDFQLGPTQELALLGGSRSAVTNAARAIGRRHWPNKVLAARPASSSHQSAALHGLFAGKQPPTGDVALFVCQDFACQAPILGEPNIVQYLAESPTNATTTR